MQIYLDQKIKEEIFLDYWERKISVQAIIDKYNLDTDVRHMKNFIYENDLVRYEDFSCKICNNRIFQKVKSNDFLRCKCSDAEWKKCHECKEGY